MPKMKDVLLDDDFSDDGVYNQNVKAEELVGGVVKINKVKDSDKKIYMGESNPKKFKTSKHKTPSRRL